MKKPKEKTYWTLKEPNGDLWHHFYKVKNNIKKDLEGRIFFPTKLSDLKKQGWEIVKVKLVEIK